MSLRDAIARAAFEDAAKAKWEDATPDDEREFYEIADAVLAALRTELAAHPESIEELTGGWTSRIHIETCESCDGSGAEFSGVEYGSTKEVVGCSDCAGVGHVFIIDHFAPDQENQ